MYRTQSGKNVLMKAGYFDISDAESCVVDAVGWIAEDQWNRGQNSSTFNLTDGSCFVIYKE